MKDDELQATVEVVLSVPMKYLNLFIADWDDLRTKMQEIGGVEKAVIKLPDTIKEINLELS